MDREVLYELSLEEETPELRLQRLFGPPEDPDPSEED